MDSEKEIVIKCWNCQKKFTTTAPGDTVITIYKSLPPSANPAEPEPEKTRLLKTCPYCGKDNEIEI